MQETSYEEEKTSDAESEGRGRTLMVTSTNKTATAGDTVFLPCLTPSNLDKTPQVI